MKKQLLLALLVSGVAVHAMDRDGQVGTGGSILAPESSAGNPQNMFIPIPLIVGGAAVLVAKKSIQITKGLVRNPLVAGGVGALVVAPLLKRTIFAQNPDSNPNSIAASIKDEWNTDFAQAQENFNKAHDDFKVQHPIAYKKMRRMYDAPQMQKMLNAFRQGADNVNQWCIEQKEIIFSWFVEDENKPSDNSQKAETITPETASLEPDSNTKGTESMTDR